MFSNVDTAADVNLSLFLYAAKSIAGGAFENFELFAWLGY